MWPAMYYTDLVGISTLIQVLFRLPRFLVAPSRRLLSKPARGSSETMPLLTMTESKKYYAERFAPTLEWFVVGWGVGREVDRRSSCCARSRHWFSFFANSCS